MCKFYVAIAALQEAKQTESMVRNLELSRSIVTLDRLAHLQSLTEEAVGIMALGLTAT